MSDDTGTPPPLPALDPAGIGPPVGERFPDVQLPDQVGRVVDVHEHRGGGRLLFVVHRSAHW